MGQLDNKIAIITGAGSGFGEGMATAYIREGAKVLIADLNGEAGERVAKALGPNAKAVTCDVANEASVKAMVQVCVESFGIPDIVINNAGTTHKNQPMLNVDEKTFDRVFNVNVKSIYFMTHAIVPLLRQRAQGGVIINVGSTAGIRPRPGLSWYNASKGAVNLLSRALAVELAPDNIRVNALCPVMGATGLLGDFMGMPDTPENRAKFVSTIPLGRFCEPKDMAAAAVFLGTDGADFLTGLEMPVDGGRTI